jgi:hypothetical protein
MASGVNCRSGRRYSDRCRTARSDDRDADGRAEVIWTADPQVTRDAADVCAQLARSVRPGLGPRLAALPSEPPPPADLRRAAGLLSRMTGYLEKTRPPAEP